MVDIYESYNNDRILQGLREIRPELNLGTNVQVEAVEADAGYHNVRPVIKVTLNFPVSKEEWRAVLEGARDEF